MALFRAQILLDETQHRELERMSRDTGRSMSELVREIMTDYLTRRSADEAVHRSLAALNGLATLRQDIEATHGLLPPDVLDELRDERDSETTP